MTTVISVENLSKVYRLGQIGTGTFTYDMQLWWARVRGKPNPLLRIGEVDHGNRQGEELWALKSVSFTVEQGEVLGIIGRNGAGKSTLLKILSRVTAPTSGRIRVKGRIASLLEVGTGFHAELTGRENIYLNGAILGMKRDEITRKFDEIVDFAELGKFIDTPVKRYSSGMYVRLAFAVAAHLEPEILIVDEVLAVGDAAFQKKCLGKMQDVAAEGRTVLFVSHNIPTIIELCTRGILLRQGQITKYGAIGDVAREYLELLQPTLDNNADLKEKPRPSSIHLRGRGRLLSCEMNETHAGWNVEFGSTLTFQITFRVFQPLETLELGIGVFSSGGLEICSVVSSDVHCWKNLTPDEFVVKFSFPELRLMPGNYYLGIGLRSNDGLEDYVSNVAYFNIIETEEAARMHTTYRQGLIVPRIQADLEKLVF